MLCLLIGARGIFGILSLVALTWSPLFLLPLLSLLSQLSIKVKPLGFLNMGVSPTSPLLGLLLWLLGWSPESVTGKIPLFYSFFGVMQSKLMAGSALALRVKATLLSLKRFFSDELLTDLSGEYPSQRKLSVPCDWPLLSNLIALSVTTESWVNKLY